MASYGSWQNMNSLDRTQYVQDVAYNREGENSLIGLQPEVKAAIIARNTPSSGSSSSSSSGTSLQSLLSGAGAPISGINLSATPGQSLVNWADAMAPRQQLQQYTGDTNVQMSPETLAMLNQISQFAQSPTLQQLLSGQTNQGLFQAGVVNPLQRDFNRNTLPGIDEQFSGGAYGSGYNSGARQKAGLEAQNKLNEQIAGLRYQDYNQAQDRSIQAAGLLPSLAQALSARENLASQNMDRGIDVHYKNQNLTSEQFKNDMDFVNSLLGAQNNLNQQALTQQGQMIGQAGDIRSNALTLQQLANNMALGQMSNATTQRGQSLSAMTAQNQLAAQQAQAQADRQAQQNLINTLQNQNQTNGIIPMNYNSQSSGNPTSGVIGTGETWGYRQGTQANTQSVSPMSAQLNASFGNTLNTTSNPILLNYGNTSPGYGNTKPTYSLAEYLQQR